MRLISAPQLRRAPPVPPASSQLREQRRSDIVSYLRMVRLTLPVRIAPPRPTSRAIGGGVCHPSSAGSRPSRRAAKVPAKSSIPHQQDKK
jgi:hypothetical protein